ncbi:hypothetical protein [Raineyella fluvialis]|uniref:Uncharacterized protein n=1 Tax=Raineyella fluvialis TaxID=2662261 RepID=A0A5Q2F912_9ACTN|nr:hypothetical protein [Raineyella fluvialis]QGF23319.1 hypothetical protein Rai3103_06190 [Raineyella fluvialis]
MTYDVVRLTVDERHTQLVKKSVGPVLLQFRAYAMMPPEERPVGHDQFYMMWMDLDRRSVPVPAVIRAALAPATAHAMTARVFGHGADQVPGRLGWWRAADLIGSQKAFEARVTARLAWLVDEDMGAFLRWDAPDPEELARLEPAVDPIDAVGRWVFDRFTLTDQASWAPTSRDLEAAPDPSIRRRLIDLRTDPGAAEPPTLLEELSRARHLIAAGQRVEAASLLSALITVRPFDPEILTELAHAVDDPEHAALLTRRAASYRAVGDPAVW